MDLNELWGFIDNAKVGNISKEDLMEKYEAVGGVMRRTMIDFGDLTRDMDKIHSEHTPPTMKKRLIEKYGSEEELNRRIIETKDYNIAIRKMHRELNAIINSNKNFNKSVCFSNIRELLNHNPDVKIGQIEREAGIRLGYMSRLEKEGNPSDPSIEFIITAAKLLNVSVDTLISYDIAGLTSSEYYLLNFIEKLKMDTLNNKLNWLSETKFELERHETDFNGVSTHPLLTLEDYYIPSGCEYPEPVTGNMYVSKTYELDTIINDDSFSLRLKNGATLFLMNVKKRSNYNVNTSKAVIEAVMFVPNGKTQVLATTNDAYPISQLLDDLYQILKEHMKHPQVNKDAMYAIDAFMKDDLTDDEEELPF